MNQANNITSKLMETKQTAVEWFISETYHLGGTMIFNNGQRVFYLAIEQYDELLKQAKQIEKAQICDAWENGFMDSAEGWNGEIPPDCQGEVLNTEQYYNETYGKE